MSSSSTLSLDHLPPSEQLCYVHCNICDTVLAVSYFFHFTLNIINSILSPLFTQNPLEVFYFFNFFFCASYLVLVLGECPLHQFVQDCNGKMWALHQPPASEHARVASAFG